MYYNGYHLAPTQARKKYIATPYYKNTLFILNYNYYNSLQVTYKSVSHNHNNEYTFTIKHMQADFGHNIGGYRKKWYICKIAFLNMSRPILKDLERLILDKLSPINNQTSHSKYSMFLKIQETT